MLHSGDELYGKMFIFQQDLDPSLTAKSTITMLNNYGATVLANWP